MTPIDDVKRPRIIKENIAAETFRRMLDVGSDLLGPSGTYWACCKPPW